MSAEIDDARVLLRLVLPGATPEQLAAGLAAARHHLAFAELDPVQGHRAFEARAAWRRGEGPEPSVEVLQDGMVFQRCLVSAIDAAIGLDAPRPEGIRLLVGSPLH